MRDRAGAGDSVAEALALADAQQAAYWEASAIDGFRNHWYWLEEAAALPLGLRISHQTGHFVAEADLTGVLFKQRSRDWDVLLQADGELGIRYGLLDAALETTFVAIGDDTPRLALRPRLGLSTPSGYQAFVRATWNLIQEAHANLRIPEAALMLGIGASFAGDRPRREPTSP